MIFTKKYRTGQIVLTACIVAVCMFSNVHGTEAAGPPAPKTLTVTPTEKPKSTAKSKSTSTSKSKSTPKSKSALTQKPEATPIPASTPTPEQEAETDKLVFIGDSRTEGLRDAVNDDSIWSCLSSMGYDWMVSTGVPQVEDQIEDNTAVIILMGVNDLYHVNDYISYINSKAAEWGNRGAQTYFVSVGPVQNDPYCSNAEIESFNAAMQANLSGVTYIDVYSHLVSEGFSTVDGTHYPDSVSVDIYNYILDHLEEQRSGIWG